MKLASASDFKVAHEDCGEETRTLIVRAHDSDQRDWVAKSPLASQLASKNITNVGITWAKRSFEMLRKNPGGPFFLACFNGSGVVVNDGAPLVVDQGSACILPWHTSNHLQMGDSSQWTYGFVRYRKPWEGMSTWNVEAPKTADYDALPLVEAIRGLYAEASGAASASALQLWVELIHHYVLQFARPHQADSRVTHAWDVVISRLGHDWTLNQIAVEAAVCPEHFRRLCQESLGCSPMKHLIHVRMRRASTLLATSNLTIEAISFKVGYQYASTFSNTFYKWSGLRPSDFRRMKSGRGKES